MFKLVNFDLNDFSYLTTEFESPLISDGNIMIETCDGDGESGMVVVDGLNIYIHDEAGVWVYKAINSSALVLEIQRLQEVSEYLDLAGEDYVVIKIDKDIKPLYTFHESHPLMFKE